MRDGCRIPVWVGLRRFSRSGFAGGRLVHLSLLCSRFVCVKEELFFRRNDRLRRFVKDLLGVDW